MATTIKAAAAEAQMLMNMRLSEMQPGLRASMCTIRKAGISRIIDFDIPTLFTFSLNPPPPFQIRRENHDKPQLTFKKYNHLTTHTPHTHTSISIHYVCTYDIQTRTQRRTKQEGWGFVRIFFAPPLIPILPPAPISILSFKDYHHHQ